MFRSNDPRFFVTRCVRAAGMGALAVAAAAALSNCGGGGGSDDDGNPITLRLYFGMAGKGACGRVVVNVDLSDIGNVLAHDGDEPSCDLDPGLAANGCDATFTETTDRLSVAISGCTIPETTNLFSCDFEQADISELSAEITSQCTCKVTGCDGTPPICVDLDADPLSCEDCDNRRDDDGDGDIDCDDPNCEHQPACDDSPPITTVTSTTLPPDPITVEFTLTSATAPVGALDFTVNYTSAPGFFEGSGEAVKCTKDVSDVVFTKNDKDSTKKLTLTFDSVNGFDAPQKLASCSFMPDTPVPVPSNFTIVINNADDTDGERVNVHIGVAVKE